MCPSPSAQRRASVLGLPPVTWSASSPSWSRTLAVRALPDRAFVTAGTTRGPARGGKPGGWRAAPVASPRRGGGDAKAAPRDCLSPGAAGLAPEVTP